MRFAEMTAPRIRALDRERTLVVAPIAACEQHARHLPTSTDTILCGAVADGLERVAADWVLLLPVLWIGASEHHLPFGGTLTSPLGRYEDLLVDLATPLLRDGFQRLMFLNGHGGNIDPMRVALRRLDTLFPEAMLTGAAYWDLAGEEIAECCVGPRKSMGHACEIETSMMLHLRPELVERDQIEDDPETKPSEISALTWARDFGRSTDHGAVGYPSFASAEAGKRMLDGIVLKVASVAEVVANLPMGSKTAPGL